jgi:hypothetical protein
MALNLIAWIECNYLAEPAGEEDRGSINSLASQYLGNLVRCIFNYKVRALQAEKPGWANCEPMDLKRQLGLLLARGILGLDPSMLVKSATGQALDFGRLPGKHKVSQRTEPGDFEGKWVSNISNV